METMLTGVCGRVNLKAVEPHGVPYARRHKNPFKTRRSHERGQRCERARFQTRGLHVREENRMHDDLHENLNHRVMQERDSRGLYRSAQNCF
ncbi:hypothetical protein ACOCG7_06240 [Paraburkholderia sp. DD10]|uniref:Ribosome-binding protein aMBF1 (Putative translation factor) n=1 Tax=Paraburkholderia terricola TaxID=169427 RepID=A0ABU1LQB6_9BURK|nr:hypothetical protein [Paraburkholderia terricola]MDR6408943.1 ribosome-binding protein aMBF1 (putative translation factor) [Paraburkholderia terricola]MDR6482156.1 ribosome-binding protein aMBF1 (putative translation factor) [Paraburkholderia terricola]